MFPLLYMWLTGWHVYTYIYIYLYKCNRYIVTYKYIYIFIYLLPQSLSGLKFADNQGSAGIVSASETATSVISLATLQISCWCLYIYVYINICQLFNIKWNTFRYLYIYICIFALINPNEMQGWVPLQSSQLVAPATYVACPERQQQYNCSVQDRPYTHWTVNYIYLSCI